MNFHRINTKIRGKYVQNTISACFNHYFPYLCYLVVNMKNTHLKIEDSSVLDFPILLCENYVLHSGGLEKMIYKIGFHGHLEIVTNLKNALQRLENYETELLIIGIHDDKEQYLAIILTIIKKYPELKIILISDNATAMEQGIYRKMGVKGFIRYGISQPDLDQVFMNVRIGEKAFDLPDEKGNKRMLSADDIVDLKLDSVDFIIIQGVKDGITEKKIAEMDGVNMTKNGVEGRTRKYRETYLEHKTIRAIERMEERGLLDEMGEE